MRKEKLAFRIPLTHIFGFVKCYNKIIYRRKHALSLYRTSNNKNAIFLKDSSKFKAKLTISKLLWLIPKIIPTSEGYALNEVKDKKIAITRLKRQSYGSSFQEAREF